MATGDYLQAVDSIRSELKTVERFVAVDASASGWKVVSKTLEAPENRSHL